MKFRVSDNWRKDSYFIEVILNWRERTSSELYIAKFLELTIEEYFTLIKQNGGFLVQNYYHFQSKQLCYIYA